MKIKIDSNTKWIQVEEDITLGHLIDTLQDLMGDEWKNVRVPGKTIFDYGKMMTYEESMKLDELLKQNDGNISNTL